MIQYPQIVQILKSLPSRQQVERKTKGGLGAVMQFSFTGSLSHSCAGFMTFAISIRYSCATSVSEQRPAALSEGQLFPFQALGRLRTLCLLTYLLACLTNSSTQLFARLTWHRFCATLQKLTERAVILRCQTFNRVSEWAIAQGQTRKF